MCQIPFGSTLYPRMEPQEPIIKDLPQQKSIASSVLEWIKVIVIALIIALPIRFFIAEPFIVQGASMDPTFSTGQFLIIDRVSYRFDEPKRGDVIVFEYPNNPDLYYIKRIIGLPGETVSIKAGIVTVTSPENTTGTVLTEPYIDTSHISSETLSVDLGETEYFVMGDNRTQSSDSRSWGPLERDYIVGRPIVRLIPIHEIGILPGAYTQ